MSEACTSIDQEALSPDSLGRFGLKVEPRLSDQEE